MLLRTTCGRSGQAFDSIVPENFPVDVEYDNETSTNAAEPSVAQASPVARPAGHPVDAVPAVAAV